MNLPLSATSSDVFGALAVRPVINCCGIYTDLGGSVLSASVWKAIAELNGSFVRMTDLLDSTGSMIAAWLGAEAARITPGASAAIALAIAATMTGSEGRHWEQLPDTRGLRNRVLMARSHLENYKYAICARMPGAMIVTEGPADQFVLEEFTKAITPSLACVLIPAHLLDGFTGVKQLAAVVRAAHAVDVPVVVDAAYMCYPVALMRAYATCGADLTCFSAKYFNGPSSGGFVTGARELVRAVEGLDFTRFESGKYRSFGRAFKMSRYDVAATTLALQEWLQLDHTERWREYAAYVRTLSGAVQGCRGIDAHPRLFTMSEDLVESDAVNCLAISFDAASEYSAASVARTLENENPIIAAVVLDEKLVLAVDALLPGQAERVAARLKAALSR